MEEPKETELLRAVAATVESVVDAETAAVIIIRQVEAQEAIEIYAPHMERANGPTTYGPAMHDVVPNRVRRILRGDDLRVDDVTSMPGYIPLWTEERALAGGALASLPIEDDGETIGAIVARRQHPFFSREEQERLHTLEELARYAIVSSLPVIRCERCRQLLDVQFSLATFVDGEWHYGHKNCYSKSETPLWYELSWLRTEPIFWTRASTTAEAPTEHLSPAAIASWYKMLGEVLGREVGTAEDS